MFPVSAVTVPPLAAPASPSPALLARLSPEQCASFLRDRARLPLHLREVAFDLHGTDWTPEATEQLGDALCDFPDVFSRSKSDLGSCSLTPFAISVPEGSAPVASRPHRIIHIMAKEMKATLEAGLVQHSTSPYSSPLVVISKKSGGVRITMNYYYKQLFLAWTKSSTSWGRDGCFLSSISYPRFTRLPCTRTPSLSRRFALPRGSTSG